MSGILGQLLGGSSHPEPSNAIADILQQVLTQNGGGVGALISRFENAGFGDHMQSWVSGDGDHLPITGNHIGQIFTPDEIAGWAQQAGINPDMMKTVLAEALPHAVDHATPDGAVPAPTATPDLSSLIGRFFSGAAAILLLLAWSTGAFADETVAGKWLAHLGSNVAVTMNVTPDGKWDSATTKNGNKLAQMAGTYQQQVTSPTHGMLVFTPTQAQVTSQHGAAEVENDLYEVTDNGQVMHLTSGGDTMTFHKQ
jgi:uncharacterized protein YidB (DUF937 family)